MFKLIQILIERKQLDAYVRLRMSRIPYYNMKCD